MPTTYYVLVKIEDFTGGDDLVAIQKAIEQADLNSEETTVESLSVPDDCVPLARKLYRELGL